MIFSAGRVDMCKLASVAMRRGAARCRVRGSLAASLNSPRPPPFPRGRLSEQVHGQGVSFIDLHVEVNVKEAPAPGPLLGARSAE